LDKPEQKHNSNNETHLEWVSGSSLLLATCLLLNAHEQQD
jgi:hypothetical protein